MVVSLAQLYNILVRWGSIPIRCPYCFVSMSFRKYYSRHAKCRHGVVNATTCPFCTCFVWPRNEKARPEHVLHRLECAKTFLKQHRIGREEDIFSQKMCVPCQEFNSNALKHSLEGHAYLFDQTYLYQPVLQSDTFLPLSSIECTLESGLGQCAPAALNAFYRFDWFHTWVCNFDAFVAHIQKAFEDGWLTLLPFWCCCRNGRHVLIACRKGLSLQWTPVDRIASPLELAQWICKTSQPGSGCGPHPHYWFNRPVYPHALEGMCATFHGGLQDLLTARCYAMNVEPWHDRVVMGPDGWMIPIQHTGAINVHNCVLPVRDYWEPTPNRISEMYVPGLKLWFRFNDTPKRDWYRYQIRLGNALFQAVRGEMYVLSWAQQATMDRLFKLKMEWNVDLLQIVALYQSERDRYKAKYEALLHENSALEKMTRLGQTASN